MAFGDDFEPALQEFLAYHRSVRKGERLRRLVDGLGHGEELFLQKVWWPAFGSFRDLHPEYEITDFDGRSRFLDFAYLSGETRLAIEIDGYGPHVTSLSRWQFVNQLRRQNHLILDGWAVLRFSYDEITEQPR
ncbi:MAG TPA: DNA-binding response regulator, partial [Bacillota bacterium]